MARKGFSWTASPITRPIFEIAFQWFMRTGEWPTIPALRRYLFQANVRNVDVQAIADSKPQIPGQLALAHQERLILELVMCSNFRALTLSSTCLWAATHQAVLAYGSAVERPSVRYDNQAFFGFDSMTVVRFLPFVTADYPNAFAGGAYGEEWDLAVNDSLVAEFDGATNPIEYVQRQLAIIKRWCAEEDARRGIAGRDPSSTAFVVMPFREEWSNNVYGFIQRAVDRLGGRLEAIRADEIAMPGRINDQIMEAIRTADLVIADITGLNANVFWELGFAVSP